MLPFWLRCYRTACRGRGRGRGRGWWHCASLIEAHDVGGRNGSAGDGVAASVYAWLARSRAIAAASRYRRISGAAAAASIESQNRNVDVVTAR